MSETKSRHESPAWKPAAEQPEAARMAAGPAAGRGDDLGDGQSESIAQRKAEIRRRLICEREQLPRQTVAANSRAIVARLKQFEPLLELLAQKPEHPVGLFAAFRGEVDVRPLTPFLVQMGARVAFPAIVPCEHGRCLRFGVYRADCHLRQFLCPGYFGVSEPPADALLPFGAPMSALIVPGVAFDRNGCRLGFGKGFYDQAIAAMPERPLLIGVAHPFQLLDEPLPRAPHDQCLDCIILPDRTVVVK